MTVVQRITIGGMTFLMPASHPQTREEQLENELAQYRQRFAELMTKPKMTAFVLGVEDATLLVDVGNNQTVELPKPRNLEKPIAVGDEVKCVQDVGIVGVVENPLPTGMIATVKQVIDERVCEVAIGPQSVVLPFRGAVPKAGDRVVLNRGQSVIVKNIGAGDSSKNVTEETGVEWDDIGGQEDAKRALREAIEEPHTKKDVYAKFGMRAPRGVLLHGPPGNGKTMLGKAAATCLAKLHGVAMSASGFIYVKGPELLDKFVGESESNIRKIFAQARAHREASGFPAVIFIDECDAILGKRGSRAPGFEGIERTVIPQFLSEMDGMFESHAFVLLATNRPDVLDGAVVRDGRIDRKVHVKRPSRADAVDILARLLVKRPVAGVVADVAKDAVDDLYSGKHVLEIVKCKGGEDKRFTLAEIVSGAILAGLVDRATQRAIRRAVQGDENAAITSKDLHDAIDDVVLEQRDIDHEAAIRDFVEAHGLGDKVTKVEKAQRGNRPLIVIPGMQ